MSSKNIELWSNPKTVFKKARETYGNNVKINISTRKDKKYMIQDPETNKWIHFGQFGAEDFTRHKDITRRDNFLKRNHHWANSEPYTPSYMSYYLLW